MFTRLACRTPTTTYRHSKRYKCARIRVRRANVAVNRIIQHYCTTVVNKDYEEEVQRKMAEYVKSAPFAALTLDYTHETPEQTHQRLTEGLFRAIDVYKEKAAKGEILPELFSGNDDLSATNVMDVLADKSKYDMCLASFDLMRAMIRYDDWQAPSFVVSNKNDLQHFLIKDTLGAEGERDKAMTLFTDTTRFYDHSDKTSVLPVSLHKFAGHELFNTIHETIIELSLSEKKLSGLWINKGDASTAVHLPLDVKESKWISYLLRLQQGMIIEDLLKQDTSEDYRWQSFFREATFYVVLVKTAEKSAVFVPANMKIGTKDTEQQNTRFFSVFTTPEHALQSALSVHTKVRRDGRNMIIAEYTGQEIAMLAEKMKERFPAGISVNMTTSDSGIIANFIRRDSEYTGFYGFEPHIVLEGYHLAEKAKEKVVSKHVEMQYKKDPAE